MDRRLQQPSARVTLVVCCLLTIHALLLGWGAWRHSPAWDEVGHLPAGLSHWQLGRFELYNVNPPLVRMVACLPLQFSDAKTDWTGLSTGPGQRAEFQAGMKFVQANGEKSFWYFTVARWACIPFSLLGGYICFRWASELYGVGAGLLALVLWCFCPNIIAHGQMITPDVGATSLGVTAFYLYWHWLKAPRWTAAFGVGLILGMTELTKTSWIILFVLWPALWLIWNWSNLRQRAWQHWSGLFMGRTCLQQSVESKPAAQAKEITGDSFASASGFNDVMNNPGWRSQLAQLAVMFLLAIYVINLGYGFEGSFQRLGKFEFISRTLGGHADVSEAQIVTGNRFTGSWLGQVPVPLPRQYVLGIDVQKWDFERKMWSYLRGQWRKGGWWYYYLYGLAIKLPLGTWIIVGLAGVYGRLPPRVASARAATELKRPRFGPAWRDELLLIAPVVAILTLVSSQTGFNHHLRYVLPIFPFAFIWASRVTMVFRSREGEAPAEPHHSANQSTRISSAWRARALPAVTLGALAWSIFSSLWVYPHSLSYFNELVGGPMGGHYHLGNSNIDWGQDLLYLKRWLEKHPEAAPIGLAYDRGSN